MTNEERAAEYAQLFTRLGDKWRMCVPIDGTAHKSRDEMKIQGVRIAKRANAQTWELVSA